MTDKTLGVPNLVNARSQQLMVVQRSAPAPSRLRSFFSPIFTWFPFDTGKRTFRLWPGGGQAQGPVNLARSYGGVNITPELSLSISAVWACVWRYANTVMSLPLCLYRSADGQSAMQERAHPLWRILHSIPNQDMSSAKFWQAMVASMMTWGVCYARKMKINGRLVGLRPMRPEYMTAYLDSNGRLRYRYWPMGITGGDKNEDLSADDVFVVIDRSMDGYTGLSRIQYAANTLGLSMAGDRAANLSYKNGLRASGILTIAQWLKPDQRAAYKRIVNDFVGTGTGQDSDKQFGVMVAENATKFEPLSLKPIDVELLSSRKYSFEEICSWYDVPPILVHHATDGQTMWGSGVEQIILGWLKLGLGPVLTTIEKEIFRQLLTPEEQGQGYYAAFNLDELLRGDSAARASFLSQMTQNGVYTRNEARAKENLPKSAEPNADKLTVQSNMSPIEKLGTMPDNTVQVRDALRNFLGLDDAGNSRGNDDEA
jgi:HK97 family phage portal protein